MKVSKLKSLLVKIFKKKGLNHVDALISTNALINAEMVGAYGHGLSRLKMYCDRISKKVINPKPRIKIKKILIKLDATKPAPPVIKILFLLIILLLLY